jgi:hypothetical protein
MITKKSQIDISDAKRKNNHKINKTNFSKKKMTILKQDEKLF